MRSPTFILAALLGALALSGCATKAPPTREEIHAQSPTMARQNLTENNLWKATGAEAGPIADNWLATFDDPQLQALVVEVIQHNPDLQVAAARVEQSAQYVELARSKLRPAVNFGGTGGFKANGGEDLSSALQGLMLVASWELDLWGRLRYARNAAQETYASAQADMEFSRQSLAATTAKTWFTASETYLQQAMAADMVKSAEQLLDLAGKRNTIGAGNEQDVALARASLSTFQDNATQFRLAHEQTIRALELLLGRYPAAELQARNELAKLPGPVPAGMPLAMLERRPDIIAAERRVAAAFNRVGEAKAARLPRLTLNASAAIVGSEVLELKDDFENPAAGVGGRIVVPIYQGGGLVTQVQIRTLEQKEAVAQYARMALRAIGDVENALAAESTLDERVKLLERAVADHQRALQLAETSYRVGRLDLRFVQLQQISVFNARLALLRVQSEQLAQRVNLHLSLGGSFETPPPPPTLAAK